MLHLGAARSPSLWHPPWQNHRVRGEPVLSFDQATLSNPSEPHTLLGFSCLHLHTLPTLVTVSVSCPVIHVCSKKTGLCYVPWVLLCPGQSRQKHWLARELLQARALLTGPSGSFPAKRPSSQGSDLIEQTLLPARTLLKLRDLGHFCSPWDTQREHSGPWDKFSLRFPDHQMVAEHPGDW